MCKKKKVIIKHKSKKNYIKYKFCSLTRAFFIFISLKRTSKQPAAQLSQFEQQLSNFTKMQNHICINSNPSGYNTLLYAVLQINLCFLPSLLCSELFFLPTLVPLPVSNDCIHFWWPVSLCLCGH